MSNFFRWNAGRKHQGTPTLESQPGAHTGDSRQYIPGYSDSNIVYLDLVSGNDANDGSTELLAKLTYASAATAAGTTKKIRVINNNAALSTNITKPTEMKRGVSGTISSSLTAPVDTWTQSATLNSFSGKVNGMAWAPWLSRYIGVGGTSKAYYSADGDTWTAATSHGFGSDAPLCCAVSINRKMVYIGGESGKFGYSADGLTYTVSSVAAISSKNIRGIAYSETLDRLFIVCNEGYTAYSDDGGSTWEAGPRIGSNDILGVATSGSVFAVVDGSNDTTYFTSPTTVSTASGTAAAFRSVFYSAILGKFLYADEGGDTYFSTTGATLTAAATPAFSTDGAFGFAEAVEIGRVVAFGPGEIAYSSDGNAWTLAATDSYGATDIYCGAWSPLIGKFASAGVSKAAYSTAFANTISASIAGFTVQAVQYSGTVTAYNCTMYQPGTTAALSLNACRVTESGAHISNNSQAHFGTLFEGDAHFTAVPASANSFDFNCNTVPGTLYVYNGSETHYERIRDNIIEDGVQASYPLTVTSGNTRGTSSDGVIFGQFHTTADPMFVDETDYKIKRILDGYQYDSPMVAAAQYYYNQATTQTFRDNGAWSYNESAATYKYQRTFDFLMPATVNGSSIDFIRHNRANLHVAEDGTPDTANTPDSRWEEIVMTYKTLPESHITFIDWLEGQVDMTCEISLSPSLTPTTSVTASGATSAGEAVITVTDNSGLDSGDRLTIDGNEYTVLYTYGTTKAVLDRVTTTALSNGESITVKYDTGFGEYQYVPQLERRLSRWYETDSTYQRGLTIRFARKLP